MIASPNTVNGRPSSADSRNTRIAASLLRRMSTMLDHSSASMKASIASGAHSTRSVGTITQFCTTARAISAIASRASAAPHAAT